MIILLRIGKDDCPQNQRLPKCTVALKPVDGRDPRQLLAWSATATRLRWQPPWSHCSFLIFQLKCVSCIILVELLFIFAICTKPNWMNFVVKIFSSRLQLTSFPALFFIFDQRQSAENATESKHWLARMNSQGCQTFSMLGIWAAVNMLMLLQIITLWVFPVCVFAFKYSNSF